MRLEASTAQRKFPSGGHWRIHGWWSEGKSYHHQPSIHWHGLISSRFREPFSPQAKSFSLLWLSLALFKLPGFSLVSSSYSISTMPVVDMLISLICHVGTAALSVLLRPPWEILHALPHHQMKFLQQCVCMLHLQSRPFYGVL